MRQFDIIAPVPEIISGFRTASLIGRACDQGVIAVNVHNLRDWTTDKHRTIDDHPFGGGAGMVLKPEPLFAALEELQRPERSRLLCFSPQGRTFSQALAEEYATWMQEADSAQLLMICGRYEGIDERVIEHFRPELVSIGDYVIAGGEVAAMVVVEAVARLMPGVVGNEESLREESFNQGLLEYPQYTRPAEFRGYAVPEVLLSGNHRKIAEWRRKARESRTEKKKRP